MIWTPPTTPLTRAQLRREIRAILNDYASLKQLDDAEIDRAADAITAEWDTVSPLTTHITIHSPITLMPGQRPLHAHHPSDHSAIPISTTGSTVSAAHYPAVLTIALTRTLEPTPTISVPAAATNVTTAQLDPFAQYTPPTHVLLNTSTQWWTGSADAGERILILHTEPAGTGLWTLLDALEIGEPCRAEYPPQHPTPHTLIQTPAGTYYYNGNTYTPAPPTTHILDTRDMIHIAPRAAAWIILARTSKDHPARYWAEHTLNRPYPGEQTILSQPVTPRDDWIT